MKLNIIQAALLGSAALLAQAQTAAPSRADVKAEAAKANKAGEIHTGESEEKMPMTKSNMKRADVKAETAKANKAGEIQTGEEEPKRVDTKSNVKRADVKAETAKANKAHTIPPMGEK